MAPEHVCTVQPLRVSQNALFIIDIDVVNFEDLKADDLGSWKGTGTKRMYFRVSLYIRYSENKPNASLSSHYLQLTHHYYIHKGYAEYHRMIADVQSKQCKRHSITYSYFMVIADHSGQQNKYGTIQYWFDGPPIEVKIKPHGNSHSNTPLFCTMLQLRLYHHQFQTLESVEAF